MPKETRVTCDGCGHDITYTGNSCDWRLALLNDAIPIEPSLSAVTDMLISPKIKSSAYFCDVGCLAHWLQEKRPTALNDYERLVKHRDWLKSRGA